MSIMVAISETAKAQADALVASGRFDTVEEAIEVSLSVFNGGWIDERVRLEELTPELRAKIEAALIDIEAGHVVDADVVFDALEARYSAMVKSD